MKWIRLMVAVALGFCVTGCSNRNVEIGSLDVIETPNPSVYELTFMVKDTVPISVSLENQETGTKQFLESSSENENRQLILPFLKPGLTYTIELLFNGDVISEPFTFRTRPLNSSLFANIKKKVNPEAFEGFILTQRKGSGDGYIYMLDADGDVVWYQRTAGIPKLSQWVDKYQIMTLLGNAEHDNSAGDHIVAYRINGDISWEIDMRKHQLVAHHEVLEHNGDIYTLVYDSIPYTFNGSSEEAVSTAVLRLNKDGEILWKWSTFDVVQPSGIPVSEMMGDWGHANALAFDSDGNLLISYRDWNQIWKVDSNTGKRLWVLGEQGDVDMDGIPFDAQHAVLKDPEDNYMLFDNGRKKERTRVVSYEITENQAKLTRDIELPSELFSVKMGNAAVLPNKNILVCASGSESIVVMDSVGTILYHITTGIPSPYRATYVPAYYTHPQ